MPVKAGQIVIDITSGTAKFVVDMEKAKAKIHEFGSAGVSEHKQVAAAVKALEGNFLNNTRAADAFLASIKGVGPIIQAAFPIIGAIAFAGVLVDLGKKVYEFFKGLRESSEKSAASWNNLLRPMKTANDELDLSNAKLEQEIAKLQGKRQNNLAIALTEAKVAADKLGESLIKDLDQINKLLFEKTSSGFLSDLQAGGAGLVRSLFNPTKGGLFGLLKAISGNAQIDAIRQAGGGESGQGGLVAKTNAYYDSAKTVHDYDALIGDYDKLLKTISGALSGTNISQSDREALEAYAHALTQQKTLIPKSELNVDLTKQKGDIETAQANAKPGQIIQDRINEMQHQAAALHELLATVNAPESQQVQAKAYQEALKAIDDLNKKLEEYHTHLSTANEDVIKSIAANNQYLQSEIQTEQHFRETNATLAERITAQKELSASIGATYDAAVKSGGQVAVAQAIKGHENDSEWLETWADRLDEVRQKGEELKRAEIGTEVDKTSKAIQDHIALEQRLATAYHLGAEAVRQIQLEEEIRVATIGHENEAIKIRQELTDKYTATQNADQQKILAGLQQEINAATRLANVWGGADALRQARNQNKYDQMRANGQGNLVPAEQAKDEADEQERINKEANEKVFIYQNQLAELDKIEARIMEMGGDEAALLQLEKDRLEIMAKQNLALGTAKGGLEAYFQEAQASAKTTGQILYDSLNDATNKLTDELTKLMTGQKTSWSKMFKDIGADIEKETIQASLKKGIGALGKALGIPGLDGKPDGSNAKPFTIMDKIKRPSGYAGDPVHVVDDNQSSGSQSSNPNPQLPGIGGSKGLGGLFGSGDAGGGIFSLFGGIGGGASSAGDGLSEAVTSSFTAMANGGDVSPYSTYLVGENAPEMFVPRTAGSIVPLNQMGGQSHTYHIDARGAALGVENRISRAIDTAHSSAIQNSVQATHERSMRTPQRTGR